MPGRIKNPTWFASQILKQKWQRLRELQAGFDLCFLGMGEDTHTTSIFSHSPLIHAAAEASFTATETPQHG